MVIWTYFIDDRPRWGPFDKKNEWPMQPIKMIFLNKSELFL